MSTVPFPQTRTGSVSESVLVRRGRRRVEALRVDLDKGVWSPTALEARVADMLVTATAADGMLTSRRLRAGLWEGSVTMLSANGGRFAQVLASLVAVLDDPDFSAFDLLDTAGELVMAITAFGRITPVRTT
ncbi:hypothetical protein ACFVIM_10915 [Streptomyces sp. NPDC057638]|uniref:hypothetical protein n=1 Tax=Streptomyces sp. NPDC057638 TaxID=3346190 RepID=UPI00369F6B39